MKRLSKIFVGFCFYLCILYTDTMGHTLLTTYQGTMHAQNLGRWVEGGADVNGDTFCDVITGQYGGDWNSYILFGGDPMDSIPDVILPSGLITMFAHGVGFANVNGDGYDDAIIGQSWSEGNIYIYYGGNPMDDSADIIVGTSEQAWQRQGDEWISGAGDVNDDGYEDVIIGASEYNSHQGRAYIYYGGNPMDTTADVVLTGETSNSNFAFSVSSAGDVNYDGFDDVIIGAHYGGVGNGRAYLYYGGDPMDTIVDVTIAGQGSYDYFGYSVTSAGNGNGDNYSDVIIGAP